MKDHLESVPPFLAHNAQGLTKGDLMMILVMILVLMILVMMLVLMILVMMLVIL